ncbi:glycosyltransferase family 4 protein [Cryobacterium gelidum]|uniref:D-inositol 3-phosphate glycosyltransferase n=1 Tax=Cryobacterium gelidum TaxID=1259164 RepID=A0A4R9AW13_9MICO|nr:glycosyltransferase family 4 protein [Cryobacterium gelidum]TFD71225.1 glycosyltransferase [Cryobacterium gelidum]
MANKLQKSHDVMMALNYYAPYVSGLTDAARLVAEELVRRGLSVIVVAGQHDAALPRSERINGVDVVRTPVVARIGKGLISPTFVSTAIHFGRRARIVNLHLPMIESGPIAAGLRSTPVVVTYQCDISLPAGILNRLQTVVMDISNAIAMRCANAICPSSADYAASSRLQRSMSGIRTQPIAPPTRTYPAATPSFRTSGGLHVGFLGRLVEEKGLEFLVDGFRQLEDPEARLLIGGDFSKVAGGSVVEKVRTHIGGDERIRLLGFLRDDELPNFYASLDVFALPSVNSLEAFGIVQVEAMKAGVAALASDLPGVRTPVQRTGFGSIVAPRDSVAIERELRRLSTKPLDRVLGAQRANAEYSLEQTVDEYQTLFESLV